MNLLAYTLAPILLLSSLATNADELISKTTFSKNKALKSIVNNNPNSSALVDVYDFSLKKMVSIDIYKLKKEDGFRLIAPEDTVRDIYLEFVNKGLLPILAVQETNKLYIDSLKSSSSKN